MLSLAEIDLQLATINAAISDLIAGKRVTRLEIGSGNFKRTYAFQEITLESLQAIRADLLEQRAQYSQETPVFRQYASIPLVVRKDIF